MRFVPVVALLALATPAAAVAQGGGPGNRMMMGEALRDAQVRMLEYERKMLVEMADSMPERWYRDPVTPIQRDFAQQVQHIVSSAAGIPAQLFSGPTLTLPDTAQALNSRAGLKTYINAGYDYAVALLKSETMQQRMRSVNLFGMDMPGWLVWDQLHHHNMWTAGEIVANFRKHGMAPPEFGFF